MAGKFAILWLLAASSGLAASCQVPDSHQMTPPAAPSVLKHDSQSGAVAVQVVRQIDDPHTGDRWLLLRESDRPGGPGRLVHVVRGAGLPQSASIVGAPAGAQVAAPFPLPVIRGGDKLIVEDNSARLNARFEAVALGVALAGGSLRVRLLLGGKVIEAVALGPGRAAFAPKTEVHP